MEKLESGQRVRLDNTETTVNTCWAQGKHWTIILHDGRRFSGAEIDSLMQAGRLELLDAPKKDEEGGRWGSPFGEDRED